MKVRRRTPPVGISPTHQNRFEISQRKKICFTFEAGMLLKTKVGKMASGFAPNEFMKIKELLCFPDEFLIQKELAENPTLKSSADEPKSCGPEGIVCQLNARAGKGQPDKIAQNNCAICFI